MPTNFYLCSPANPENKADFIGRLDWSGAYCFDCDLSLVTGKKGGVDVQDPRYVLGFWYQFCPQCKRGLSDPQGHLRFTPTEEEIADQGKYLWPVRFSLSFYYALPIRFVKNLQKDTPIIDHCGAVMTADFFKRNFLDKVKFHFSPRG